MHVSRRLVDHVRRRIAVGFLAKFVEQVRPASQRAIHVEEVGRGLHRVNVVLGQSVIDVEGVGGGRVPTVPRLGILYVFGLGRDEVAGLEGAHDAGGIDEERAGEGGAGMFQAGDDGAQSVIR